MVRANNLIPFRVPIQHSQTLALDRAQRSEHGRVPLFGVRKLRKSRLGHHRKNKHLVNRLISVSDRS